MQMVELVDIILVLSIEVLERFILAQPLKATSREKTSPPGSNGFMTARKLYCLAGRTHSGVSGLAERPRDVDKEVGGQRSANTESRKCKSKRSKRSDLQSKSRGPRL